MGVQELLVEKGLSEGQVVNGQAFPAFSRVDLTLLQRIEGSWIPCNKAPIRCTVMPWPEIREYDTDAVERLAGQEGRLRLMFPDGHETDSYPSGHPVPIKLGEQVLQAASGQDELFRVDVVPVVGRVIASNTIATQQ